VNTARATASGHRYAALDGLRGFAVLLVFCVHAAGNAAAVAWQVDLERTSLAALSGGATRMLFWLFRSHHGVFLFFVLSGFLIGRMWWPVARLTYATFAWRRTVRIYPAFLVAFAASLLFAWSSGTWSPPDVPRLIGNLLFLNAVAPLHVVPFNIVTWSLFYEMTFYLAFPAFALAASAFGARAGVVLWTAGTLLPLAAVSLGADAFVLCWSLLFLGVAAAVHEAHLTAVAARLPTLVVVALYLAVTTGALFDLVNPAPAILAFGVAAVFMVGKCLAGSNVLARAMSWRPLRELGRMSYSFYLLHWMIVVLVARVVAAHLAALGAVGGTLAIFVAGFALSAAAASCSWWLAERPYFDWTHARRR
jgi:exopolysaccharide production protein ExoZ